MKIDHSRTWKGPQSEHDSCLKAKGSSRDGEATAAHQFWDTSGVKFLGDHRIKLIHEARSTLSERIPFKA